MDKVIKIQGKELAFRATALTPRLYRHKMQRDIIQDFSALERSFKKAVKAKGLVEPGKHATAEEKAAYEEAEHAAKFAELLGEVVTDSTKKNLQMRVEAENGATAGKTDLANRAKAANLDAIHDTVHEMARDEARHGKAFAGLLKRYFNA